LQLVHIGAILKGLCLEQILKHLVHQHYLENGTDRANRTDMTLLVNGYIIPSGINAAMAGPNPKSYNVTKTIFKETINS
jgi:hypothetical protein